jgi:CMP/dCMP kinase
MKKQILTIAGALGSGKSSTAKRLAQALEYRHFSSGDMFRKIAQDRNVTIEEINKIAELESSIDRDVDEWLRSLGKEENIVIDSRLAFHWIPDSFKVYLDLDTQTAAERIFKHMQEEGRVSQKASSVEELVQATLSRKQMEKKRYHDLYQIDMADLSPFDLVVDTSKHDLNAVVEIVLEKYKAFLAN